MLRLAFAMLVFLAPQPARARQLDTDTPVELMVMREVSARTAIPGERFRLEVIAPVRIADGIVIAAGATAWGEVVEAAPAGGGGRGGRIGIRLVCVEAGAECLPLDGRTATQARRSARDVTALSASLGPFALLARGHDARIKAGERLTGFVAGRDAQAPASGVIVRAGTPVVLATLTILSSETVARGDRVEFALTDALHIDGVDVVPAGARAFGEVVRADRKGGFGVGGRLGIALLYLEAGSQVVRLDGQAEWSGRTAPARGLSSSALAGAAAVALTGRSATVGTGTRVEGRVLRDVMLPLRR